MLIDNITRSVNLEVIIILYYYLLILYCLLVFGLI